MNKAIVDTTVLTDILLNSGEAKAEALKALNFFNKTLLPVYAIKEFKAGPLKNFVWMHNKLVLTKSFWQAIDALQRMSRTPKRYTTSTALQSLKEAAESIGNQISSDLVTKYGENASLDKILCDEFRFEIKVKIISAWKKRRKITSDITNPLPCYREIAPYEKRKLLELDPMKCNIEMGCYMADLLKERPEELRKMRNAIINSDKTENQRRAKILRQLYRTPRKPLKDKECRYLGDAVFVFLATSDTVILSTNIVDHAILAEALNKKAATPKQIISKIDGEKS